MIIDYNKAEFQVLPNFKGGLKEMTANMYFDGKCRILRAKLVPGASIGLHTHETNSEIMFITKGSGKAILDGVEERVSANMMHYCPKGSAHTLINDGTDDLEFFAAVPEQ